jgi:putative ABC transport system substrate-binding protein
MLTRPPERVPRSTATAPVVTGETAENVVAVEESASVGRRPRPERRRAVLILTDSDSPGFLEVAEALSDTLPGNYEVTRMSLDTKDAAELAELMDMSMLDAAVAVGGEAAELLARAGDIPVVFCQVLDYERLLSFSPNVYGVEPFPPLSMQIERWRAESPDTRSLGVIVSTAQSDVIDEMREITRQYDIDLYARFAETDREALYRFKRLVPNIDAFWLYPDTNVLSPGVIREMLEYGFRQGVQSVVFNPPLLEWGAFLSVSAQPADVATAVIRILDRVVTGNTSELPRVAPLNRVEVEVNSTVAGGLRAAQTAAGSALNGD